MTSHTDIRLECAELLRRLRDEREAYAATCAQSQLLVQRLVDESRSRVALSHELLSSIRAREPLTPCIRRS